MSTLTTARFVEFLAWATLACGYLKFIYFPIFRWGIVRRLYNHRNNLQDLCVKEGIPLNSFPAAYVRNFIEGTLALQKTISLSGFLHDRLRGHEEPSETAAIQRELANFESQAPMKFRKLHWEVFEDAEQLMALNSPGWFVLGYSVYLFSRFFVFPLKHWFDKRAVVFVEKQTQVFDVEADDKTCTAGMQ